MEVHHHSHHPKKFKEYITEFLMLFLAVSLGFFAENLREHQVEKEREIKFLQNIHQDLQNDIKSIDEIIAFNKDKKSTGDSLLVEYEHGKLMNNIPGFYYYVKSLPIRALFDGSKNGFIQLKNAGGLRLIQNPKIINDIQRYEIEIAKIDKLQEIAEATFQNVRMKASRIIDVTTSNNMNKTQDLYKNKNSEVYRFRRFIRPQNPKPLLITNPIEINEIINLISYGLNTNFYVNTNLVTLKEYAIKLDETILKEYGEKFD